MSIYEFFLNFTKIFFKKTPIFLAARDLFLVITLCFGLACAWIVLVRPIMMNWFGFVGSRIGDGDEYMYMDG